MSLKNGCNLPAKTTIVTSARRLGRDREAGRGEGVGREAGEETKLAGRNEEVGKGGWQERRGRVGDWQGDGGQEEGVDREARSGRGGGEEAGAGTGLAGRTEPFRLRRTQMQHKQRQR